MPPMDHGHDDLDDPQGNDPGARSMSPGCTPVTAVRERVAASVRSLFDHSQDPLADTASHPGDPGLFGPGSVSWSVIAHPSAFLGGIRALLVQAAHPEVLAGVADHSRYRQDPLGRLSRTANYVTATTFGAEPEVQAAIAAVRRAHRPVHGSSERGVAYDAGSPALAAWVHNTLTESFLVAYQRFGPGLDTAHADRFVDEQRKVGQLLGASPLPSTAAELHAWVHHHDDIDKSPPLNETMRFLARPPLPPTARAGYQILYNGALTTIPGPTRRLLGLGQAPPGSAKAAWLLVTALGWALGQSPALTAAEKRTGSRPSQ